MELKDLLKEWARTWRFEDRAFTLSAVEEELHEMGVELDSGEIERVVPRWTVDTQRLFADWEAAGCPLVWTPPGHEQEQEEESS